MNFSKLLLGIVFFTLSANTSHAQQTPKPKLASDQPATTAPAATAIQMRVLPNPNQASPQPMTKASGQIQASQLPSAAPLSDSAPTSFKSQRTIPTTQRVGGSGRSAKSSTADSKVQLASEKDLLNTSSTVKN